MLQIFVDPSARQGDLLTVQGSEYNHIRNVLRMKPGEEVSVRFAEDPDEYRYGIESFSEDAVLLRLRFVKSADAELPVRVYLFQGLPKSDKMELIVQKAVELGACRIIPVGTARSVVKLDDKRAEKKTARWQTIAESAASQSHRGALPQVLPVMSFKEALELAKNECGVRLIPYELQEPGKTRGILDQIKPGDSVAVFIGPEGGFEPGEVEAAKEAGFVPISLGRRILRTETAGLAFLSFMIYCLEL